MKMRDSFAAMLVFLAVVAVPANAGPNFGGTIFAHDASLAYTYTVDPSSYCGLGAAPPSCEEADVELDGTAPSIWKVYAAFPHWSSPRVKAMAWGIQHIPNDLTILGQGNCCGDPNNGAAEVSAPGWPGSNTGTAMRWQFTQTTQLVECYWFAGYNGSGAAGIFQLGDNPGQGGFFLDDSVPGQEDGISGYGSLGFNMRGQACTWAVPSGACCEGEVCSFSTLADCPGTYMGTGVPCDPTRCPPPTPVEESSWGRIKSRYRGPL